MITVGEKAHLKPDRVMLSDEEIKPVANQPLDHITYHGTSFIIFYKCI